MPQMFSIFDKVVFLQIFKYVCFGNILGCDVLGLRRVTCFEELLRCT